MLRNATDSVPNLTKQVWFTHHFRIITELPEQKNRLRLPSCSTFRGEELGCDHWDFEVHPPRRLKHWSLKDQAICIYKYTHIYIYTYMSLMNCGSDCKMRSNFLDRGMLESMTRVGHWAWQTKLWSWVVGGWAQLQKAVPPYPPLEPEITRPSFPFASLPCTRLFCHFVNQPSLMNCGSDCKMRSNFLDRGMLESMTRVAPLLVIRFPQQLNWEYLWCQELFHHMIWQLYVTFKSSTNYLQSFLPLASRREVCYVAGTWNSFYPNHEWWWSVQLVEKMSNQLHRGRGTATFYQRETCCLVVNEKDGSLLLPGFRKMLPNKKYRISFYLAYDLFSG